MYYYDQVVIILRRVYQMPNRFICAALLLLITLYIMSINDHWGSFEFHIHDRRCAPGYVSGGTLAVALEINYKRYSVGGLAFVGVWFCSAAISIRTELAGSVSIAKRECQSLIQVVVVEYSDPFMVN